MKLVFRLSIFEYLWFVTSYYIQFVVDLLDYLFSLEDCNADLITRFFLLITGYAQNVRTHSRYACEVSWNLNVSGNMSRV